MSEPTQAGPASPAPIDCEHAVRRLWDYVDGRLPTMARNEVEAHLETCAACLRRFDFAHTMREAHAASTLVGGTHDDAALRERVRAALTAVNGDR
jgi:anti-sigma factor RsiW